MTLRGWSIFYVGFFLYRVACGLFAELIIGNFTSLGDSERYQGEVSKIQMSESIFDVVVDSTQLTELIGLIFTRMFWASHENPYLVNIVFQTIAFYGLYRILKSLDPRARVYAAILFMAPSFNIWSSIASKEAIVVFITGIIGSYLIEFYYNRSRLSLIVLFAGLLLVIYKAHYLAALTFVFSASFMARRFREKEFVALIACAVVVCGLYIVRDFIDELTFKLISHFVADDQGVYGLSTREPIWTERYDFFYQAPYGVWLSIVGPTISEAVRSPLQLVTLIESIGILVVLIVYILANLPRLPVFCFLIGVFALFLLLFANYPFGAMNPGAAIRYRAGWYPLMVTFVFIFFSQSVYYNWVRGFIRPTETKRQNWLRPRFAIMPTIIYKWGPKETKS